MALTQKIKSLCVDFYDFIMIRRKRALEVKKYRDKRREIITNSVHLTEEQKQKIDSLYLDNYGRKIPYTWHRNYMAHSGKFDEKQFPELLFVPEFENYMNMWPEYCAVFEDKNVLPLIANQAGVKMPRTVLSVTKGLLRNSGYKILTEIEAVEVLAKSGKVFIKPTVGSCSGRGCFVAEYVDGKNIMDGSTAEEMIRWLKSQNDMIVQERLKCHESIAKIYSKSVNTFRIMTYRWQDEIICPSAVMRIGRGNAYVDNAHAGGIFVAIDKDGTIRGKAVTEFNEQYIEHPDTHVKFDGYKIDLFPRVVDAAIKIHTLIPQIGVANWDFTIDEYGEPVLVELNLLDCSIWLYEMVHGKGTFGAKTEEVLKWLKVLNKTRKSRRTQYAFGNTEIN